MAIEKVPGGFDPEWDEWADAHLNSGDSLGSPSVSQSAPTGAATIDVESMLDLLGRSRQVSDSILATPPQRVPAWARSSVAVTGYWTVAPPLLVSGMANLAAHVWPGWEVPATGGVMAVAAALLTVIGLNNKWGGTATGVASGISLGALQFAVSAGATGWSEVVAVLVGAAGAFSYKILWNLRHAKARNEAALVAAKVRTETQRGDAVAILTQLKAAHEQLKIQALQNASKASQALHAGATAEERALRKAFWDIFGEQLATVDVSQTLSGWKAVVGLSRMSRNEARNGWDKVQTALRAEGRFSLSDGPRTNELIIKFANGQARAGHRTAWEETMMPDPGSGLMSLGTDTETGEEVLARYDERLLITGASGTGKSWSTRPLMAHAHLRGELILVDGKGEEANVWGGVCQCATDTDEIVDAIEYAHDVMTRRKVEMRNRGLSVWDGSQLTMNVDEGQVVLAVIASLKKGRDDVKQKAVELSSLGRSRGVVLWWQTQYGVTSGGAPGIDNLIAANMLQRFSLRVANGTHAQVALDDCAGYGPQFIPDDRSFRGHGYLKGYGPTLIRTWTMDDAAVKALPKRAATSAPAAPGKASNQDKVARKLAENPNATNQQIADDTGVPVGSISYHRKRIAG